MIIEWDTDHVDGLITRVFTHDGWTIQSVEDVYSGSGRVCITNGVNKPVWKHTTADMAVKIAEGVAERLTSPFLGVDLGQGAL